MLSLNPKLLTRRFLSHLGASTSTPLGLAISAFFILFTVIGLSGCGEKSLATTPEKDVPTSTAAPLTIPVLALATRDTVLLREYVADVQAARNVEIRARVEGYLQKIFVDEGQRVKKNQPLFQIDATLYRTQLAKARAERENAQAQARVARLELDRVNLLVAKNIISATEEAVALAKLHAAEAGISEARAHETAAAQHLAYALVKAPFDGVIDRIPLKVGSVIEDGTLLTTASDVADVVAYFSVSESEYLEYQKTRLRDPATANKSAHLILADGAEYPLVGVIETVDTEFEATTGSISFRARFPNPNGLLKHGATGKVRLTNIERQALLVPQQAVFELQDRTCVYVVGADNRVTTRAFKPEARLGAYYVVDTGLKAGERIAVEGIQSLRDDERITPRAVSFNRLK
jgi:membrane fusion protein, multidrug efflux system